MNLLENKYNNIEDILEKKYGITDVDAAFLKIDYSKKTEFIDRYGRTIIYTRPYSSLLKFAEKTMA